jgi:protein-tyrosine phosphatase
MSALDKSPITKVLLYGLLGNMQIRKLSFPGISIQMCMPDILRRRITKTITLVHSDPSIPTKEKQIQLHSILESFYRDFALLRDIAWVQSPSQVEFICIALNADIIQLIQMVYPPSECISYDIIHTVDDAMIKYADYLEILSPLSSASSSAASSPHPVPPTFDDQISTIPFPNGNGQVIYLGGDSGANDLAKLTELGITHILNASDCIPNYYEHTTNITYMRVPIADCSSVILKDYFPTVFEFITSTLESGGRILVHCFAGKSRSASFVIAYLMQHLRMNYMDAFKHVQYHRSVVEPNLGFELQLHAFEKSSVYCDKTTGAE